MTKAEYLEFIQKFMAEQQELENRTWERFIAHLHNPDPKYLDLSGLVFAGHTEHPPVQSDLTEQQRQYLYNGDWGAYAEEERKEAEARELARRVHQERKFVPPEWTLPPSVWGLHCWTSFNGRYPDE